MLSDQRPTERVTMPLGARRLELEAPAGGSIARTWKLGLWYEAPLLLHIQAQQFHGLAVDAGANIGNHALWLALACGLQVVAFEPLYHRLLARNVAQNGAGELVTVHPCALGIGEQLAEHVGKDALKVGAGTIPVRALDNFDLRGVVLIKADVEFMEPDVLLGGERTIRRDRPVIYAEVHPGHEAALVAVLAPWGYVQTKRFHSQQNATPVEEWRHVA